MRKSQEIRNRIVVADIFHHLFQKLQVRRVLPVFHPVSDLIAENKAIPAASAPNEVPKGPDDFVVLMDFDFEKYSEKYDSRSVKKTLTIPAWLNTMSEQRGVNFSAVLQEALKENLRL